MIQPQDMLTTIIYNTEAGQRSVDIRVRPETIIREAVNEARQALGLSADPVERKLKAWKGATSGDQWRLRVLREIPDRRWWTEAEVDHYHDRESIAKFVQCLLAQ